MMDPDGMTPLPGSGQTDPSQQSTTGPTTTGNLPGIVGGLVSTGVGLSPLGSIPGATSAVTGAVTGQSFSDIQDAVLGDLLGWGASTVASNLGLGYGIPGVVGAVTSQAAKDNPNYGATALGSVAQIGSAMLGGAVAGPLGALVGGTLGGTLANQSLKEGYLGDLVDSRARESERDAVEDAFGLSPSDTESMARVDSLEGFLDGLSAMAGAASGEKGRTSAMDANLGFDFGLDSAYGSTTEGKLSSAASEAFGFDSLEGFLSSIPGFEDLGGYSPQSIDSRTDYGKGLNSSGYLGDRDLSSTQNMDRQPNETPGGLFGGDGTSDSGTSGGYGDPDAGGEGMI